MATLASTADATVTSGATIRFKSSGGSWRRRAETVTESSRPEWRYASSKVMSGSLAWLHTIRTRCSQSSASARWPRRQLTACGSLSSQGRDRRYLNRAWERPGFEAL
jgi:hypothetical protein